MLWTRMSSINLSVIYVLIAYSLTCNWNTTPGTNVDITKGRFYVHNTQCISSQLSWIYCQKICNIDKRSGTNFYWLYFFSNCDIYIWDFIYKLSVNFWQGSIITFSARFLGFMKISYFLC